MADESSTSSLSLSASSQCQDANLEECYRNYRENKVTKDNVWTNHLIDDFQRMIRSHHQHVNSFQTVGSMLEASSQIYGLKVDCVHSDVLRLSSGIRRANIIEPVAENVDETMESGYSNQSIFPIRRRQAKTTIVGNSQLINAKLETVEEPGGLLMLKANNTGKDAFTKTLLQNVLASDKYAFNLQSKNKFWIDREATENELREDDSAVLNADTVDLPTLNWVPSSTDVVRTKATGYAISNTPCELFRYQSTTQGDDQNQFELGDIEMMPDPSWMELQFDINAEVVPPQESVEVQREIVNDSLNTEDDVNALRRCSALQRKTLVTDDLRPLTTSPLEYSYRRHGDSTGTNYWKVPSLQQSESKEKKRRRRRKIAKKDKPVVLRNLLRASIDEKFVSVDDPLANKIKKVCYPKWDPNKLKRPSRMSWSTLQSFAPGISDCIETHDANIEPENEEIEDNLLCNDAEITSNLIEDNGNRVTDMFITPTANDEQIYLPAGDLFQLPPIPLQTPMQPMQITPANMNIKEVTKRCFEIICDVEAEAGTATFAYVYHKLRSGNQPVTQALVFSSILQLANEHNFHLHKIGENDFQIKRIRDSRSFLKSQV